MNEMRRGGGREDRVFKRGVGGQMDTLKAYREAYPAGAYPYLKLFFLPGAREKKSCTSAGEAQDKRRCCHPGKAAGDKRRFFSLLSGVCKSPGEPERPERRHPGEGGGRVKKSG